MIKAYKSNDLIVAAYQMTSNNIADKENWPDWLLEAKSKNRVSSGSLFMDDTDEWYVNTPYNVKPVFINFWIVKNPDNTLDVVSDEEFQEEFKEIIALEIMGELHQAILLEEPEEFEINVGLPLPLILILVFSVFKFGLLMADVKYIHVISTGLLSTVIIAYLASLFFDRK